MAAKNQTPTVVDKVKSYESELSTVFGFIVVVVIGAALLFFLRRATLKQAPQLSDIGGQTSAENLMKDQAQKPGTYTVKAGDHVWKIAQTQMGDGYQWTAIAKANNLKAPYVVREGQTLTIPTPDPKIAQRVAATPQAKPTVQSPENLMATPAPTPAALTAPATGTYTVKKGDNLWKIAVSQYNNGYKWVEIYRANSKVIGKNPGIIRVGQQLTLPSGK